MVHIKKVEIYGFKSFGYKNTVVNMEKGVICVTGPNGSGKSNILDAIMFALGENSPKILRVDKLRSLFHDQSEGRIHKLVRSSVSFDNTDRGIPIDSNTVTITREMPPQGESEYYLNGKKVTKMTITELLDVVLATPNKLNVVQQGMIMRIAELNPEERRHIIEDIVGLSYFDEKKIESTKQLDEADRRLEVAMARMGEIRKRIDDLEGERNDQLKFQHLEKDTKRFKAIKISNSIQESRKRLESQKIVLEQSLVETEKIYKEFELVKTELSQLESEKTNFLQEVNIYSRAKAEVDSKISNMIMKFEQLRVSIASSEQRVKKIGQNIPLLMNERESLKKQIHEINIKINELNSHLKIKEEENDNMAVKLDILNAELKELLNIQSEVNEQKLRLEVQLKDLETTKGNINVELSTNIERVKFIVEKLETNTKRVNNITNEQNKLEIFLTKLQNLNDEELVKISHCEQTINKFTSKKTKIEQQIDNISLILERADSVAVRYETKIKTVKNLQHEDYAIAMLIRYEKDFGIIGTFMHLVKWEKEYERAVIAVASLWMKALVVKDVKNMLKILDHARKMNLPRLRMIPLDITINHNDRDIPAYNGVIDLLSNVVTSDKAPNLVDFIFGDTILVNNPDTAYELAKKGWKTVTITGEMFEPKINAITLDLNSKISDLTKTILLGESVENLKDSIDLLKQFTTKKKTILSNMVLKIKQVENNRINIHKSLAAIDSHIENIKGSLQRHQKNSEDMPDRISSLSNLQADIRKNIEELEEQKQEMNSKIMDVNNKLNEMDKQGVIKKLSDIGFKKIEIGKIVEHMENEIRKQFTVISSHKAEVTILLKRINDIVNEIKMSKEEAKEQASVMKENNKILEDVKTELKSFRDREQQLIDTSGNSVSLLQEYDVKIKIVSDQERKFSKQMSNVEKDIALNRKEITDLTASETKLMHELMEYGYSEPLEGYNVTIDVAELVKEYDFLRGSINQLADKNYIQIIDGYRGMSSRKNQLESERNSIVKFLEDVEREKKQVFMEAFDKVNKDVRHIFSTMIGDTGSAWLEIENPDDVFNSGLMLIVQFPNKPPRESNSLSGGEKTIVATTFLLALQSLKPSPFYLFDEVDAHLDAQNTERLAKIVVEKSKLSQIIIVTLKDAIVAKAQIVHGVYPRDGVSQLIKYKSPTAKMIN